MPLPRSFETNDAVLTASNPMVAKASVTNVTTMPQFDTVATTINDSPTKDKASDEVEASTPSPIPSRQTHGASFVRGPITSVQQLIGLRNVAKGSMGSFETVAEYRKHVEKLTLGDLHTHAVESNVVPIDDRDRLLRRLETEWTTVASRAPGRGAGGNRPLSTPEKDQRAKDLLKATLRR